MSRIAFFLIVAFLFSCSSSKPTAESKPLTEPVEETTKPAAEADPCAALEGEALSECRLKMATLEAVCTNGAYTPRGCQECPEHEGLADTDEFFELVSIESLKGPGGADLEKKVLTFEGCRPDDAQTRFELVAGDHETPWVIEAMELRRVRP